MVQGEKKASPPHCILHGTSLDDWGICVAIGKCLPSWVCCIPLEVYKELALSGRLDSILPSFCEPSRNEEGVFAPGLIIAQYNFRSMSHSKDRYKAFCFIGVAETNNSTSCILRQTIQHLSCKTIHVD